VLRTNAQCRSPTATVTTRRSRSRAPVRSAIGDDGCLIVWFGFGVVAVCRKTAMV
jgi:hypothetical protein